MARKLAAIEPGRSFWVCEALRTLWERIERDEDLE